MSESGESPVDVQRALAVAGGLGLVACFVLPFAEIVDPDTVGTTSGRLLGYQAGSVPLVLFGLGAFVLSVSALRWTALTQVTVGVCGLVATLATLVGRAWLASESAGLRVGVHEGPATAFEPGIGTVVAFVAGALVVAGGLGAVLDYAVTRLSSED